MPQPTRTPTPRPTPALPDHAAALADIRRVVDAGPFSDASWDTFDRYRVPDWYRDGKLGIFSHWGPYCVPAYGNEWYPRHMYEPGHHVHDHHVKTYGPLTEHGYKDFIPRFTAERYDPADWADLFAAAGAAFVMPVAEHHDGFAMYDTPHNRWNAAAMGPKRDVTAELADAVRARGLTFAVSTHREENCWFYNHGHLHPSDVQDPAHGDLYGHGLGAAMPPHPDDPHGQNVAHGADPGPAWLNDWLVRTCELVDKFRPGVVFFDWWIEEAVYAPHLRTFTAYYYNRMASWGLRAAVNYKNQAMPATAGVYDIERGQLKDIRYPFWQTDTSLAYNSWGYIEGLKYRTPEAVIHDFIDSVSKNGALLINVAPRADGTIPDEQRTLLKQLGGWMTINQEGIKGTRPWKLYGEGPTAVPEGMFAEKNRADFGPRDLRFTTRAGVVYAHVLGWPDDGVVRIENFRKDRRFLPRDLAKVELLGHRGELKYVRDDDAMKVTLPDQRPGDFAWCLKLTPAPGA